MQRKLSQASPRPECPFASRAPGGHGGCSLIRSAFKYRIWLDQSFWIDVIEDHHLVAAEDFQGRPGCSSAHKIALYSLSAGGDLILQLSGGVGFLVRLTIVPMPADTPRSLR
jgi:hypothetical protein